MIAAFISVALVSGGSSVDPAQCWSLDLQATVPFCQEIAKLGRFDEARFGPLVGGRPTIEARFEPTYGTGVRDEKVALLQERGGRWEVIWEHQAVEGVYMPPKASETRYRWEYLDHGSRIRIRGERVDGPHRAALLVETACFRPEAQRFGGC